MKRNDRRMIRINYVLRRRKAKYELKAPLPYFGIKEAAKVIEWLGRANHYFYGQAGRSHCGVCCGVHYTRLSRLSGFV